MTQRRGRPPKATPAPVSTDPQPEQVQADQVVLEKADIDTPQPPESQNDQADPLLIRVSSKLVYDVYEPASRVMLKASAVTEITCENKRHKARIISNLNQLCHGKNTLEVLDAYL
jgi:hypothetical protein